MCNVKVVILVYDILELMLFLYHDARSLCKRQRQGPINKFRALPQVPAKGPLKAYRGTIHKTKVPPTTL
jgi:hypothetical protein